MTPVAVGLVVAVLLAGAGLMWTVGPVSRLRVVGAGGVRDAGHRGGAGSGRRRGEARDGGPVDVVLVLDLLDVALATGAGVPHALHAVGEAIGGGDGEALERTGAALVLGASWQDAWVRAPARFGLVARCLEPAWTAGAAPGATLRAQAAAVRRERRRAAREAAARMGVHLVLPLGLCFLPAFVLLGLVPVMLSLADGLLG